MGVFENGESVTEGFAAELNRSIEYIKGLVLDQLPKNEYRELIESGRLPAQLAIARAQIEG